MPERKNQSALTLIEMMLALSLSIFILIAVTEIYLTAQKGQKIQIAMNTIQENSRIAAQLLSTSIRMAGYTGCEYFPVTSINRITDYKNSEMKTDTDAMTVWHAGNENTVLTKTMRGPSTLYTTTSVKFSAGDLLIISDCKSAEVFQVKQISAFINGTQKILSTKPLTKSYEKNAEVSLFKKESYFIADTGRLDETGKTVYALYMKDNHGRKTELVEGIDQMEIYYDVAGNNHLSERSGRELASDDVVMGVGLKLRFISFSLQKTGYIYAALREI